MFTESSHSPYNRKKTVDSLHGQSRWRRQCACLPQLLVTFSLAGTPGLAFSSQWWSRLGPTVQHPPGQEQEPDLGPCHDSCGKLLNTNNINISHQLFILLVLQGQTWPKHDIINIGIWHEATFLNCCVTCFPLINWVCITILTEFWFDSSN